MSSKPNTPKGTRDFSSDQIVKRNYILKILLDSFKSFNYSEIQTPSFETLNTLKFNFLNKVKNFFSLLTVIPVCLSIKITCEYLKNFFVIFKNFS